MTRIALLCLLALACREPTAAPAAADPLPSWNAGDAKRAIVQFVARVTRPGSRDFVPVAERIAVFDNDGTLWVEQPMYTQLAFALDRAKQVAPSMSVDTRSEQGVMALMAKTHANTTTDEFEQLVEDWIEDAEHPTLHRRYTDLVYAPMLELLDYLRRNGFSTYIVSGGGVEFLRPWAERVYRIPRDHVIGSRAKLKYEADAAHPVLMRLPAVDLVDDGPGKPVGIQEMIGRRPIAAFGNSDGDFEMLEWTTTGPGPRLGLLVHHTDDAREFAYDRDTKVGRLARALDAAPVRGWVVVDMKRDWSRVFK
jgi:hypothetical protein